jgi:ABC-type nitrate/sulfonate/bicarbonate transport system substrate-binding protein
MCRADQVNQARQRVEAYDLDDDVVRFSPGGQPERAVAGHGVDGVVDEVGTHLVQLAWDELIGRGVYYGANGCDASQYQGDDVYIAGAAN